MGTRNRVSDSDLLRVSVAEVENHRAIAESTARSLDVAHELEVREFAQAWLDSTYENGVPPVRDKPFDSPLRRALSDLADEVHSPAPSPEITAKYQAALEVFLGELIEYTATLSEQGGDLEKLNRFRGVVQTELFSWSPCITNELDIASQFLLTAKATRVPTAQGWFGGSMLGELVYGLSFCDDTVVDSIESRIDPRNTGMALDTLNLIQALGAHAIANGPWSKLGLRRVERLIDRFEIKTHSPLVRYTAQAVRARLNEEWDSSTVEVVAYRGNQNNGRLSEKHLDGILDQDQILGRQIHITNQPPTQGILYQVAKDAIAVLDHTLTPQQISQVGLERLERPVPIDSRKINNAISFLERGEVKRPRELEQLVRYVDRHTVLPSSVNTAAAPTRAEAWAEIAPLLSDSEWARYFDCSAKLDDLQGKFNEYVAQRRAEAEQACKTASGDFIQAVHVRAERMVLVTDNTALRQMLAELDQSLTSGNFELTFRRAEDIVQFLRLPSNLESTLGIADPLPNSNPEVSTIRREMAELSDNLRELHIEEHRRAQEDILNSELHDRAQGAAEEKSNLLRRLWEEREQLLAQLRVHLGELEANCSRSLQPVTTQSYNEAVNTRTLFPFELIDKDDATLLLPQLHRPMIRSAIESDLGIDLNQITLRSQVHLLRFLGTQDEEGFKRIRKVLQKHPGLETQILESFLVNAEDPKYCEHVLILAENLPTEGAMSVFGKYSEITSAADRARKMLERFHVSDSTDAEAVHRVAQNLLRRANRLLAARALDLVSLDEQGVSSLVVDLEDVKTEILLFGSSCRVASEAGEVDLEEIEQTEVRILSSEDLADDESTRKEMLRIATINWRNYPGDFPRLAVESLELALRSPDTRFYTLFHQGEVVAFLRFSDREDGSIYSGNFNVAPEARGLSIGGALAKLAFDQEAKRGPLFGYCHPDTPMFKNYVNDFGFEHIGTIEDFEGLGFTMFKVQRRQSALARVA